jgi:16S rRNA (cytosine1402-N4)-methyltransferase
MTSAFHQPVLGGRALGFLAPMDAGFYLDGTVGGGGHALMILEACAECRLLAVDRDPAALAEAGRVLEPYGDRVRLIAARFDEVSRDAEVGTRGLDGALLDLGVSSRQLDDADRGFTFGRGAPLDMRMGRGREDAVTAADLLNELPVEELGRIFHEFGEERRATRLAREVVKRRATEPFRTSDQLVAALHVALGRPASARDKARIFQALRIAVNHEIDSLTTGLPSIRDALNHGGVLVVIAYHSIEDRIAKHAFREWSRSCVCPPELPVCGCRGRALGETLTRSPVFADEEEVERNPRARSARLRAWRRAA